MYRLFAQLPFSSINKRILNQHSLYLLTMLQIFRVLTRAAGFKGCSNNQGIVKTKIIACLQVKASLVKSRAGHDPPQGCQNLLQKALRIFGTHGKKQFARHNIERLLDNWVADPGAARFQRVPDQSFPDSAFTRIGFVEQVDKNVRIDKFTAHSFHLV